MIGDKLVVVFRLQDRSWRVVSLFRRSLMTRRASVIGMLVYRDSTSKDTMISSGSMVCC